jgi:copper(I)-binding protein
MYAKATIGLVLAVGFGLIFLNAPQAENTAQDTAKDTDIIVQEIWSPPSISAMMGVAYGVIENKGTTDDALMAISAEEIAESPEIHNHEMQDGVFRMRKLEQLIIPAGKTVTLAPGGLHMMLIGLKKPLLDHSEYSMILHFKHHQDITIKVAVSKARLLAHLKSRNTASHQ